MRSSFIQFSTASSVNTICVPNQLLQELLGVQPSAGNITTFVTTCHRQLAKVENSLKAALVKTNVIHQDETGLHVSKTGWWVHVCSTDRLTHYAAHPPEGAKLLTPDERSPLLAVGMLLHPISRSPALHGLQCRESRLNRT